MKPKPLFPAAHVITRLSPGAPVEHAIDEWHEPHGALQSVVWQDPKCPGIMFHARLGASGVQILRVDEKGPIAVCIPLEQLFTLAGEINPKFNAPLNKNLPGEDLAKLAPETGHPNASGHALP
jgi:hypothetical protein